MSRPYPSEVIREAERHAQRAGRTFLTQLAEALPYPATLHRQPRPMATCWLDHRGAFNNAQTVVLSTPSAESFEAPSIVRVSINYLGFDHRRRIRRRMGWDQLWEGPAPSAGWYYELSLLAEQLPTFVPWVAMLAKAKAHQDERLLFSPPDACHFWIHPNLLCDYAWSVRAWEAKERDRLALEAREARQRARRRRWAEAHGLLPQ